MKDLSSNEFAISLPTKSLFELRIADPSQAFALAGSLLHLLSLFIEPRDTQWLVSQLAHLDTQLKKWIWSESVQTNISTLETARVDAVIALLGRRGQRAGRLDGVLRLLFQWIQSAMFNGNYQISRPSTERALDGVLAALTRTPSFRPSFISSSLPDALRQFVASGGTKVSPKARLTITQILQISNSDIRHSGSLNDDLRHKQRNAEIHMTIDTVLKHLLTSLGLSRDTNQDHTIQLRSLIFEKWASYSDSDKCTITETIGLLACAAAGKLRLYINELQNSQTFVCSVCDGTDKAVSSKHPPALDLRLSLLSIMQKTPASSIIVAAVRTFGRLVTHDTSPHMLSLSKSTLPEAVLNLLSSKNRDQRIAVTQVLPLLFKDHASPELTEILSENRRIIFRQLQKFQSLSNEGGPLHETTVMAYSEIGNVATHNDLCFVLTNLVNFLGHNNSFIAALAYRQIPAVAAAHGQSTWQMFSPFWPNISVKVIELMRSRPQILQRLSEILDIRDSVFLTRTQSFTVPPLVVGKHRDLLEIMSQKMGVRVWEMLKENMAFILARLFTQENRRIEIGIDFLIGLMAANKSSDEYKPKVDTRNLILSCRTPLAIELLKMLGSESDAKRERVFHALQTVALYVSEKPMQPLGTSKAQDCLKTYLENNILELMNHFTDIITDKRGRKTFTEKIGCIAGIQEIVRFAASASKSALPQV